MKTFWPGWTDRQEPDGTVHVTTPTGRTYTTKPFSALLFPGWNITTAPLQDAPLPPPPTAGRGANMPSRTRSRAQACEYRITQQRRLNAIQRELDHAAAQAAAAERQARRDKTRDESRRALEQQRTHDDDRYYPVRPPGYQPDYGNDPPPF